MSDPCPVCGTPLPEPRRADKRYCSVACKQKAMRERKQTMSTDEGKALAHEWREGYHLNRLAIHYLNHVYVKYGAEEAKYAALVVALIRDGKDFKDP